MPESSDAPVEVTVTLAGDLHARPAGALSVAVAKFDAAVELTVGANQANAKSVLAVMQLGASSGQQMTVRASGPDADAAVAMVIGILTEATEVGD
jgi:phosphotransferase system HPr (HPr) family protein